MEIVDLDLDYYLGGVGLWGAVPAVYDTTRLAPDRGIHVHARRFVGDEKEIDATYSSVRLVGGDLPKEGRLVSALDAIYYMVGTVFGFEPAHVVCDHCGHSHLDQDWYSVHPHQRHLCEACGKYFDTRVSSIANPIVGLREAFGAKKQRTKNANRTLELRQSDYVGGIQVWGSNPALIWTSGAEEEEGIHVHAFAASDQLEPTLDQTFSKVTIDGVDLSPTMVRFLMAQNALPHLRERVVSFSCLSCGESVFSSGLGALDPRVHHRCNNCSALVRAPGRRRRVVGNPLRNQLKQLATAAPRTPQIDRLDLLIDAPMGV